jgi:hypothetical protein
LLTVGPDRLGRGPVHAGLVGAFFRTIRVKGGKIADFTYDEPFASFLSSHKGSMVDLRGRYSNSWHSLIVQLHRLIND